MRIGFLFVGLLQFCITGAHSQASVVGEMTLRISSGEEQSLYYRFAAGDEIQFSFSETQSRKLKSVQILEWPEEMRYDASDIAETRMQHIVVRATGVYCFRFWGGPGEREVSVSIKRKPSADFLLRFDTAVRWETRQDTFYRKGNTEWPGWIYRSEKRTRRELLQADTAAITVLEKTERIFPRAGVLYGSNTSEIRFSLPQNQYLPSREQVQSASELISWAYWIGVGDEADRSFKDANIKAVSRLADMAAGLQLISSSSGYGALALLAVKGVAMFSNPPKGDNVQYTLWNDKGKALDSGNSIVAFRRMEAPLQGDFMLQLSNDNVLEGINVSVKILAAVQQKRFRKEDYLIYHREPVAPDLRDGKVIIREVRAPALGEP